MRRNHFPLLFVAALLLFTLIACRSTGRVLQRLNDTQTSSGEIQKTAQEEGLPTAAAISPPSSEPIGDEFDNLLDGLLHDNEQADDLADFPDFGN